MAKKYWQVFFTFFKIGLFTFGGGYAMIPLIEREVVEKHHWIDDKEILDIVAIAESTPGPIAINSATFVGYQSAGIIGALCATIGVVLPSLTIIIGVSYILKAFESNPIVKNAFWGIRAGVLALIVKALYNMYSKLDHDYFEYIVIALSFVLVLAGLDAIYVIIICALIGILYSYWRKQS